ncbi:hypothetical protein DAEQUDRAFT_730503 [Daedalea quercina L-15889]|uniref:Uncharacterized protein n=1 Tax=Daedalea quercina L-15889 TaxID=1314783 RepID=A0A165MY17_9APHY|nr:hypothetical protein DAEQUDRAFT_730503 [Daedalea quercina L-15889]
MPPPAWVYDTARRRDWTCPSCMPPALMPYVLSRVVQVCAFMMRMPCIRGHRRRLPGTVL